MLFVAAMELGISDDVVLERANQERAMLLTADKDFGELVFRQKRAALGVILVRLAGLSPNLKAEITVIAIQQHSSAIANAFTVVTSSMVRIRHNIS